ncbi:MAG: DUF2784 domain-containing protein [Desulfobulbaceae bacterium]|nr:DUF2784 domain-containing protein [Desulfobulbaceae bacterium]
MPYLALANLVVFTHFAFILFVVLGGFLLLRWPRLAWLHLPAAVWGAMIEFMGWICPLTPLEDRLRTAAGQSGYRSGFIDHYLLPLIYPGQLTRRLQFFLGLAVVLVNATLYGWLLFRRRPGQSKKTAAPPPADNGY